MGEKNDDMVLRNENDQLRKELKKLKDDLFYANLQLSDLQEAKAHYETIANFAHDWEFWLTPDQKFKYCSPSCIDLTGFSSEELSNEGFRWESLIYPVDLLGFKKYLHDILGFIAIELSHEFRILTRSKQVRWCEINSASVYDSRGKYLGARASVRDITKLKNALGHIKQLSDSKEYETKAKSKYKSDLDSKDRELVTTMLIVSQKNTLINYVKKQLATISKTTSIPIQKKITEVIDRITASTMQTSDWESFKVHFEKMQPGFFERLNARHPHLTAKERNLCAYLRLNLSSKEIAGLLNITPESAEIARVRLRKKLKLERKVRLTSYINQI